MKVLHTADWHIGKKLHKKELDQDFDLFISWLCELIQDEQIEVLIVSGDIFDLANPSAEARAQYYRTILSLKKLDCKIILTGGNHDSPSMLNAPAGLLKELKVEVIGGLPDDLADCIIPIHAKNNDQPELVVAAIPFLRDADLKKGVEGETTEDKKTAIRQGIESIFSQAANLCDKDYPNVPALAMGHLFAAGMESSDSERDIQIGNLAAFNANQFPEYFNYIALGHIHKPQQLSGRKNAFYSGSPLPLSFSEYKDDKRVLIFDSTNNSVENRSIPVFRKLKRLSGDLNSLTFELQKLKPEGELPTLVEVILREDQYDAQKLIQFEELIDEFSHEGIEIVKHRTEIKNDIKRASSFYSGETQLEDLQPADVFDQLLDQQQLEENDKQEVKEAFLSLLEEVQQRKEV